MRSSISVVIFFVLHSHHVLAAAVSSGSSISVQTQVGAEEPSDRNVCSDYPTPYSNCPFGTHCYQSFCVDTGALGEPCNPDDSHSCATNLICGKKGLCEEAPSSNKCMLNGQPQHRLCKSGEFCDARTGQCFLPDKSYCINDGSPHGSCPELYYCPGTGEACKRVVPIGKRCDPFGSPNQCGGDGYCRPNENNRGGTCTERPRQGEACQLNPNSRGDQCFYPMICIFDVPESYCDYPYTKYPNKECSADIECEYGICKPDSANSGRKYCSPGKKPGERCTSYRECVSGKCILDPDKGRVCAAEPKPAGQ